MNLADIQREAQDAGVAVSLVLKEYIHGLILDYLFKKGLFSHLVFQGGTALRMCYGGVRYSEDLDFVLSRSPSSFFQHFDRPFQKLSSYMEKQFPFVEKSEIKIQKKSDTFLRWHLRLNIPELKLEDRTNIEVANVPSYTHHPVILQISKIPFHPAVVVETPEEILCDKIVAFSAREYLKGRDIWDLFFLLETLKLTIHAKTKRIVQKKLKDYHVSKKKFNLKFHKNIEALSRNGVSILRQEMDRFLPLNYRKIFEDQYDMICKRIIQSLENFKKLR
ncbi:MAG: nucleotidyl transferase AbiEii/AbiGii toxin family protein [Deltaproteobacteria bacterium]